MNPGSVLPEEGRGGVGDDTEVRSDYYSGLSTDQHPLSIMYLISMRICLLLNYYYFYYHNTSEYQMG